jgi:lipopolysaccharide/colanic/teichoic acid biosynthesis glycosyltransferase
MLKRSLDLLIASVSLLLASPVMLFVAVMIRLTMGRPVLFRQERPGLNGRPFVMLKFRTMRQAVDMQGASVLTDHERLTRFGSFLRSFSIDELPELINVIRGDMSLVGPRPLLLEYLPLYTAQQARRHEVRPGITGWAQVNGRNALTWDEKFQYDVWYVDHRSLWLDVRILFWTAKKVLSREGIGHEGQSTMPRFTGTSDLARNERAATRLRGML